MRKNAKKLFALILALCMSLTLLTACGGDTAGSGALTIKGPCGEITLEEGVIAAKRHIHMTPADAEEYGVKDKDVVSVKVDTDGRSLIFGDVVVRVSDKYALAMHIDTDESNAAGCGRAQMGEIVK